MVMIGSETGSDKNEMERGSEIIPRLIC